MSHQKTRADPSIQPGSVADEAVLVADVNRDGKLDVVVATDIPNITPMLGDGTGKFLAGTAADTGGNPVRILLADLNGDTFLDAVTANYSSNNLTVRLGNGAGAFATVSTYGVGTNPNGLALGDA